jgi:membrane protein DedA with SNARE-associated domain
MGGIVEDILSVPEIWLYVLVGLLVFAEDALFFGFVIPGETAAVLAGVQAWRGHAELWIVVVVVVAAAIAGDSVGYEVGRHFGPRIMRTRLMAGHQGRLAHAQAFLARRGGTAVFFGRFLAFFRATMPALAGISHMPYRRFLAFNAAGGLVWGVGFTVLGYLAGDSYHKVEKLVGRSAAGLVLGVVLVAILIWKIRAHRNEKAMEDQPRVEPQEPAGAAES